jgi:hypothetical protein
MVQPAKTALPVHAGVFGASRRILLLKRTCSAFFCTALMLTLSAPPAFAANSDSQSATIKLWNGNKTTARQIYEQEVLEAALDATKGSHGKWKLSADATSFPSAEEEGSVFRAKGFDIFGTVMGNVKLAKEKKIVIPQPIMKGLLGYRILIIREADREKFAAIKTPKQLQALRLGIPETWADAELFRRNGYTVVEKGSFDDLFTRLRDNEFDYVSFGANEVDSVFAERASKAGGLAIDSSLLVYYPFPVVFYVNADNPALAQRVTQGLKTISTNGTLDKIFERHYGEQLAALKLNERRLISLRNHVLPKKMNNLKPVLIKK